MEKAYLATLIAIMYVEIKLPLPSRNGRRDMNVCMRATFKCTWEEMIARLEHNMSTISAAHTGWTVAKESDHSFVVLANITDFSALSEPMMNEEQVQWDKNNGVEYIAYTMQPMGGWANGHAPRYALSKDVGLVLRHLENVYFERIFVRML